jgi:hypothetical protein
MISRATSLLPLLCLAACTNNSTIELDEAQSAWLLVENFESGSPLDSWTHIDVQNDTDPFVPSPQIAEIQVEPRTGNRYLMRKPAADGVVGNRKAIGFVPLPVAVQIGETHTFYTRINVEYFPNNHSFGLANVSASEIPGQHYNSFEPMIRVTDKWESDGSKNDGTLMVLSGNNKAYRRVTNSKTGENAKPLRPGEWYELWYVVNNEPRDDGGQRYDLYMRGGEFETRQLVFEGADFRMRRTSPLLSFMTICNTGPHDRPYGNGGVRYDDIYMASGRNLTTPLD